MFADAIEKVGGFTRPIKFITRNYKDNVIAPGCATLFFVNDEGWALTCKHVAKEIIAADQMNNNFNKFKADLMSLQGNPKAKALTKGLEQKYNIAPKKAIQMKVQFPECVNGQCAIDITLDPDHDVALLHFRGYDRIMYHGHAVFSKDSKRIRPGDTLVRLGFPFPEFSDFSYDEEHDDIIWSQGRSTTPRFPIDGMYTRNVADKEGRLVGIELSTPGLRGQSGGPLFDSNGLIYGMQSLTKHLHLGFDMINEHMVINGRPQTINNQPFLHVGHCVHVDVIKAFLDKQGVKYYEE
ncbi:MAG: trypsin-like peptidase domain-containing protein [Firmicutes bacterium]|nr:trypsin-like peptidase domain-containing protein [Bacillota bacterium]